MMLKNLELHMGGAHNHENVADVCRRWYFCTGLGQKSWHQAHSDRWNLFQGSDNIESQCTEYKEQKPSLPEHSSTTQLICQKHSQHSSTDPHLCSLEVLTNQPIIHDSTPYNTLKTLSLSPFHWQIYVAENSLHFVESCFDLNYYAFNLFNVSSICIYQSVLMLALTALLLNCSIYIDVAFWKSSLLVTQITYNFLLFILTTLFRHHVAILFTISWKLYATFHNKNCIIRVYNQQRTITDIHILFRSIPHNIQPTWLKNSVLKLWWDVFFPHWPLGFSSC